MHFNIYVPGTNHPPSKLAELGLPGLVDGAFCATSGGPDGSMGTVFAWMSSVGRNQGRQVLGYDPAKQAWKPCAAWGDQPAGRYWYGTINDSPPTPDDLQRPYPYRCVSAQLGDGREWWFAAARDLPYTAKLADDGSWKYIPQRQFDAFCQATLDWRETLKNVHVGALIDEAREFVQVALNVNYRLVPEIESDLQLWTTSNSGSIAKTFFEVIASEGVFK